MDVLFLSPHYPDDIPQFVKGLATVGARVIGVGDQHLDALPAETRDTLWKYIQIGSWGFEDEAIATVLGELRGWNVDLVESLGDLDDRVSDRVFDVHDGHGSGPGPRAFRAPGRTAHGWIDRQDATSVL